MTPAAAREIADEQVAWWRDHGMTPEMAWIALCNLSGRERDNADWDHVRERMVRWLRTTQIGPLALNVGR